jgi:hypothetical protein
MAGAVISSRQKTHILGFFNRKSLLASARSGRSHCDPHLEFTTRFSAAKTVPICLRFRDFRENSLAKTGWFGYK